MQAANTKIYKRMKQITYELLEDCQTLIYNALLFGNRKDKEEAFGYAWTHVPNLREELEIKWEDDREMYQIHDKQFVPSLSQVKGLVLDIDLHFCIDVINKRMRLHFASPIAPTAVQIVFFSPEPLEQGTVLYEEKGAGGSERQLKVADFIAVLNHAKAFTEANLDADFDKYNSYLMAIKAVDLAINHKPVDKPLNKTLHLVHNLLTEYTKASPQDKETKHTASGISLLVDLAIDFLVRK